MTRASMRVTSFIAATAIGLATASAVWGQGADADVAPVVPSGLGMSLLEVLEETQPNGQLWLRLRFVAPELTLIARDKLQNDFDVLCADYAVDYEPVTRVDPVQAVISISSSPVEFGTTAPDVPQYFEAFRLENDTCIWEPF